MKLATLKTTGRDGQLIVVARDLSRCIPVPRIAATLQAALDDWSDCEPRLRTIYDQLNAGQAAGAKPFDATACHSPLPRAYQWADGSAYLNHVELVRRARNSQVPASFFTDPLMYQGGSDSFIGPRDPIIADSEDWGIDMEAEVTVVTDDVPMGTSPGDAIARIRLLMLVNDVSLRGLIPGELAKGFGFFQSKPASAFSPVAVTPDELGNAWAGGKVHLPMHVDLNGEPFGRPDAGQDMTFHFGQLIAHAAHTRELEAGTIVGSGTISNKQGGLNGSSIRNGGVGYCCIAEVRMYETIETGKPVTPFMHFGDRVSIHMEDAQGQDIFGTIDQVVTRRTGA
ncbi:MAG TPA: fumarylacetoacetate hydrolase family protein [Castellaniella sp.]|jgi:fumarylacetoacetate (FAA) hydrolase|nr:fumarylacetoacetate hydrolase family protein [Castellaniella sp.]